MPIKKAFWPELSGLLSRRSLPILMTARPINFMVIIKDVGRSVGLYFHPGSYHHASIVECQTVYTNVLNKGRDH